MGPVIGEIPGVLSSALLFGLMGKAHNLEEAGWNMQMLGEFLSCIEEAA
jgi:hypothetical protein